MSADKNYSQFEGIVHEDFSWVHRLVDDQAEEGINNDVLNGSSSSSSPDKKSTDSDGFFKNEVESFRIVRPPSKSASSFYSPPYRPDSTSFVSTPSPPNALDSETNSFNPSSQPGQVECQNDPTTRCLANGKAEVEFWLQKSNAALIVNREACFYLTSTNGINSIIQGTVPVFAKVIHSSGLVTVAKMKKVISTAIRCSFVPTLTGKYSAQVLSLNFKRGTHLCEPLELQVSRNYILGEDSSISLAENGGKYWGITIDKYSDKMYATDRSNNAVVVIDMAVGKTINRFGHDLYRPSGIVADHVNRRLVVCNKDNHCVSLYSMDGQHISRFGKLGFGEGEFNYPWDVDVNLNGDKIVVTDSKNHRIQMFDRYGNFMSKFSIFEKYPFEYKNLFNTPRGVTFDNEGKKLFVSDFKNNHVVSLELETWNLHKLAAPGKLFRPQGLTVDEVGNVLVCNSKRNNVVVMDGEGSPVVTISRPFSTQFLAPVDVCSLRDGKVAVMDLYGKLTIF